MNICLVSKEYPPGDHIGGIATYTYNVAHALAQLGHTVHVITVGKGQSGLVTDGQVTLHRIADVSHKLRSLGHLLHSYMVARKIFTIGCTFDIVQASEWSGEGFWYSLQSKGAPLISRLATPSFLVHRLNSNSNCSVSRVLDQMERLQVRNSAGILSSTRALARVVCSHWGIPLSRVTVIPNSLNIDRIRTLKDAAPSVNIKARDYLMYYGRLEERKGVHVFAKALPGVLKRHPYLKVIFVGADGQYAGTSMGEYVRSECAAFADRLVFLGNLPQSQLFPLVARARLVVLPSIWEAFGFVCLEAMSLGRAVIASSGSGFEEIIVDGVSGYLVQPGNVPELEARIIWCLEHETEVWKVEKGAENRSEDFRVNNVVLTLVQYYESVVKCAKSSTVLALSAK